MSSIHIRVLGDIVCVVVCLTAAAFDLRTRRVPDVLTLPALVTGLLLSWSGGGYSFATAVIAAVLLGGLPAMLAAGGGMGWGDVKLMAAVGALLGWPTAAWAIVLYVLLFTGFAGGAIAVVAAARRGRTRAALRGVLTLHRGPGHDQERSGVFVPYAVAICVGACWAVAGRYVPELLFV